MSRAYATLSHEWGVSLRKPRPRKGAAALDEPAEDFTPEDYVVYDLNVLDGPDWVDTGLVGPGGEPLMRRRRWPVGFHQKWEEGTD